MKKILLILLIFSQISCEKKTLNIDPKDYLTSQQQSDFNYSIVRYIDDIARNATHVSKFDTIHNAEYLNRSKKLSLLFYYNDTLNKKVYFAVSKIAPSLKLKKVATVGHLVYDKNSNIKHYEENFRTWKMEPNELKEKTKLLFIKYINGEDLTEYYTANSNPDFYIEFPDEFTSFDTISRTWKTKK